MKTRTFIKLPNILVHLKYVLILIVLLGCRSDLPKEMNTEPDSFELKGSIVINGAEAFYPLMQIWADEFLKDKPNLTIQVFKGSSDKGLDNLLKGHANLAMVSRNIAPEEEAMGLWYLTVSKEGVVPIISDKNPYLSEIQSQGIDRMTLRELFTAENKMHWGSVVDLRNNDQVKIFIRSDKSGTAEVWSDYLGIKQDDLIGMPLSSENLLIETVMQEPYSLSFCNAHAAYNLKKNKIRKGLSVVPIDLNNNGKIESKERFHKELCLLQRAAYLGKYPSHLCRELYLVSIGKPSNPAIIEFIKWIFTNGQNIAVKEGYAEIRHCRVKEILDMFNEK